MSRAGNDIGYCDSDYRKNNTVDFQPSEKEVRESLESLGFSVEDIRLGERDLDLYITHETIAYDFIDLDWDSYNTFTKDDYLNQYDNAWAACCGAEYDTDWRRCGECQEAL